MSDIECPICHIGKGHHKMDCQNRAYVDYQLAQVLKSLEKAREKQVKWQK